MSQVLGQDSKKINTKIGPQANRAEQVGLQFGGLKALLHLSDLGSYHEDLKRK